MQLSILLSSAIMYFGDGHPVSNPVEWPFIISWYTIMFLSRIPRVLDRYFTLKLEVTHPAHKAIIMHYFQIWPTFWYEIMEINKHKLDVYWDYYNFSWSLCPVYNFNTWYGSLFSFLWVVILKMSIVAHVNYLLTFEVFIAFLLQHIILRMSCRTLDCFYGIWKWMSL